MPSLVAIISVAFLMLFSFFIGVKYCDTIKDQSSWMLESTEEIDLPDPSDYRPIKEEIIKNDYSSELILEEDSE